MGKTQGEVAISKQRKKAWNRSFPCNPQKEPTLLTPISILYSITAENRKTFLYLIYFYHPCQDFTLLLYFLT